MAANARGREWMRARADSASGASRSAMASSRTWSSTLSSVQPRSSGTLSSPAVGSPPRERSRSLKLLNCGSSPMIGLTMPGDRVIG